MGFISWVKNLNKPASTWQVEYVVERKISWLDKEGKEEVGGLETITFYLEKDQFGNRRYTHHSYGRNAAMKKHENHEADMILWKKTGIVPAGARNVIAEKLKNIAV